MKIEDNRNKKFCKFELIEYGECFEFNDGLYMRINPIQDINGEDYNAVVIGYTDPTKIFKGLFLTDFDYETIVRKINAKIIID